MRIAIDIDGTLCWANFPVFLDECNRQFNLNIDPDILASLESKEALYALPEVQAARSERPYFDDELAWIESRERCLLASLPLDDAAAGVAKLAAIGNITYYTARYCDEPEIQLEMKISTHKWLEQQKFINKLEVIFCDRIQGKIRELLKIAKNEYIILIDDSYIRVLEEIRRLESHEYAIMRERLLLVAMRAYEDELPATDIDMVALPHWEDVDNILERILKHGRQIETNQASRNTKATKASGDPKAEPI